VRPNAVRVEGQIAYITVACKKRGFVGEAMVDVTDLERVRRLRWSLTWNGNTYYVQTAVGWNDDEGHKRTTTLTLHRLITRAPSRMKVDHRNHEGLDNRRANLRIVTNAQNMQNRKGAARDSASGVRGVFWYPRTGKWKAGLKVGGRQIHLSYFASLADAEVAAIAGRQTHMTHSLA
jgi:hypothetical protein